MFLESFEKIALSKKLLSHAAQAASQRINEVSASSEKFKRLARQHAKFESGIRVKTGGALYSRLMKAHKGRTIAGAALGAAAGAGAGAATDKEHRARGAAAGGVLGGLAGAGAAHAHRAHATHSAIKKHQSTLMDRMGGLMSKYREAEKRVGSNIGGNKAKHQSRELLGKQFRIQSAGKHQVQLNLKEPSKELAAKLEGVKGPAERKKVTSDLLHAKLKERFPDWKGPGKWRS